MYQQNNFFSNIPPVVKNLLIINGLIFFASFIFVQGVDIPGIGYTRIDFNKLFGLYTPGSNHFKFFQYISYMFMHSTQSITHVLFNMFAVFMFGRILERVWGPQKFLFYYMVTGIGAGLLYVLVAFLKAKYTASLLPAEVIDTVYQEGYGNYYRNAIVQSLNGLVNTPLVGASGAVFGLLLAFGMLFPEEKIYLYMILPLKAKYFVMGYGAIEIYLMLQNNPGDNVAHLAHLGGMLFGFFLIKYWKKKQF